MRSLRDWQKILNDIYGERNTELYSPADLLLHVFEETAIIAESQRKEDSTEIGFAVAHFFGWLLAFCDRLEIDLGKAIFSKYAGICPYCGREENCVCISSEKKPDEWFKNPDGSLPETLPEWQSMFRKIYGKINQVAGKQKVWLHVHEELGEVSKAFRLKKEQPLKEELADIFAWLVAFCNLSRIDLDVLIFATYPYRCDVCKKAKCQCSLV